MAEIEIEIEIDTELEIESKVETKTGSKVEIEIESKVEKRLVQLKSTSTCVKCANKSPTRRITVGTTRQVPTRTQRTDQSGLSVSARPPAPLLLKYDGKEETAARHSRGPSLARCIAI